MKQSLLLSSLVIAAPLLLIGLVFWSTARTRRGILFGVSVPVAFAGSADAKRVITTYRTRVELLTLVGVLLCLPPFMHAAAWLPVAVCPILIAGHFAFWQLARRQIKGHAFAVPVERKAGIAPNSYAVAPWLMMIALSLLPLAGTWLYLRHHWIEIPARFPIHWNIAGVADRWTARSPLIVALPLLAGAGIIAFMLFVVVFMRFVAVADRQRALRIMFPVFAVISWLIAANLCWVALLPVRTAPQPSTFAVMALGTMMVVAGVVIWMIWELMQSQGAEAYDGTPDSGWRAGGLVYYNPSDAAVMVPQRIGWGWTFNFARPATWWYCAAVVVIIAVIALLPLLLM